MYINFRSKYMDQDTIEKDNEMYFGYPIAIIPIKYWALKEVPLNMISEKIVEFVSEGIDDIGQIVSLLGLGGDLAGLVEHEWNDLRGRRILCFDEENGCWTTSFSPRNVFTEEYEDGYLIYDRVRGVLFPYIHEGDLYYTNEERVKIRVHELSPMHLLSPGAIMSQDFKLSAGRAVREYVRNREEEVKIGETGAEFGAAPDATATEERPSPYVYELKPGHLLSNGTMIVRVRAEPVHSKSDRHKVVLHAYSPFTGAETPRLLHIMETDPLVKKECEDFKALCLGHEQEIMEKMFLRGDIADILYSAIQNNLRVKVSEGVLELLEVAERDYQLLMMESESYVGERAQRLNNWNLIIEAALHEYPCDRPANVPDNWRTIQTRPRADQYLSTYLKGIWEQVPTPLKSVVITRLIELPKYQKIRIYGNRDRLAYYILFDLSAKLQSPEYDARWLRLFQNRPDLLKDLDRVIDVRNTRGGGHYNPDLTRIDSKQYRNIVEETRACVYRILNNLQIG